jgi:thiopeptide-type bacteriocin biosynthesis protein
MPREPRRRAARHAECAPASGRPNGGPDRAGAILVERPRTAGRRPGTDEPVDFSPQHAGFFGLRTPYLAFHTLTDLGADLDASTAVGSARPRALSRDRLRVGDRLRVLLEQPAIRDAIFVASPALHETISVWHAAPDSARGRAVERAVYRYVARMAARPTPFGLFAGTGVGAVGSRTRLTVAAQSAARRHTRLDMDYLVRLAEALARTPPIADRLRLLPNSSLHFVAGRWHYVEARQRGDARAHQLVAVEPSEALAATLDRAHTGATRAELAAALVSGGVRPAEAIAYIDELVASQILVPDLECPVTGEEPLSRLVADLRAYDPAGAGAAADTLAEVGRDLAAIDRLGPGVGPERYGAVARRLASFGVTVEPARLLQVDLVRPVDAATLGDDLVREIAGGVELLRRLCPAPPDEGLTRLRDAFIERYEQREVALVDMLDEETGIGSALGGSSRDMSALLQDIHFPGQAPATAAWSTRERWLLRRVGEALLDGRHELALSAADVEALAVPNPPPLPPALAAIVTLAGDPNGSSPRIVLQGASGPSGATLLGRFCHGDPAVRDAVRAHLAAEEALDPDAVHAEIVHLPEGRLGNILLRPALRGHDIVYLGRSGLPREQQIPVTDLMVSVSGNRFVLRSAQLGRRIVPRLTSAHNFMRHAVGVYRFLCLLQADGCLAGAAWHWGVLDALPFLPRLTHQRFVLARAQWRLESSELRALVSARGPARDEVVQAWRARRRLPRWIVFADLDNTLVVDLDNVVAVDAFVQLLHGREEANLTELYPGPDDLAVSGPEGRFAHEIVVPFTCSPPASPRAVSEQRPPLAESPPLQPGPARVSAPASAVRRTLGAASGLVRHALPGSAWVYVKLYVGRATADRLLQSVIGPTSRALAARGAIDRWFFVRYADPHHHVRWRLRAGAPSRLEAIRRAVEREVAQLHDTRLVERVAYDTYHREIERYGGAGGIDVAEALFHVDSEAVLDLMAAASAPGATADTRWHTALVSADRLLDDLGLDEARRLTVVRRLRAEWGTRLHVDRLVGRQIAKRYREVRTDLVRLLGGTAEAADAVSQVRDALAARTGRSAPLVERLARLQAEGQVSHPLDRLAESFVHMHLNRLLRAEQNLHEVVLYDFLVQIYTERIAREQATTRGGAC